MKTEVLRAAQRKQHWEDVYSRKAPRETSWYQAMPATSLAMIRNATRASSASLIDVGGGASLLVDCLLDEGFHDVSVLDISQLALENAKQRLGSRSSEVQWIEADVTRFQPDRTWEVWHDRAAFHFLTDGADRRRYVEVLRRALAMGGQAVIAAFALDGPRKCSGLDIVRYDARSLGLEIGPDFELKEERLEVHLTPAGAEQRFGFYRFAYRGRGRDPLAGAVRA
jgi:SAM-dependent methyltransferase